MVSLKTRTVVLMVCAMAAGACDKSPTDDGDDTPLPAIQLVVTGGGAVSERYTSEVAVAGDWVYTGTWSIRAGTRGNALKIWNASSGTPVLVDSAIVTGVGTLGDVQISDDGALLVVASEGGGVLNGISIYDRNPSNPAKPILLSRFVSNQTSPGVHTVKLSRWNGRHYAFLDINNAPPSRLIIVDITNPAAPVAVSSTAMGQPFVHDVFVRDGLVFTALWNDGLAIWDIGGGTASGASPANPIRLGTVHTLDYLSRPDHSQAHNVHWFHDPRNGSKRFAFVGEEVPLGGGFGNPNSMAGDIHVVDVSNFSAPREVAFFHVDSAGVHNFAVDEASGILYAAFYNGGVRALDIRGDLSSCAAAEKDAAGRCNLGLMGRERAYGLKDRTVSIWGVALSGNALYASDMLNGIWRMDIAPLKR
jgi:hypothetical protein